MTNSGVTPVNPIIIRLQSLGLGNAFFQYAAAKAVAANQDAIILFDISGCIPRQMSGYRSNISCEEVKDSFSQFRMKFGFASPGQIQQLRRILYRRGKWPNRIQRLMHRLGIMPKTYIKEQLIHKFQPEILKLQAPVYLEGTFINPHYWQHIQSDILNDLTCAAELPIHLKQVQNQMQQEPSIAIHVRRGDYTSVLTNGTYPLYGDKYVRRAIAEIESRVGKCKHYVFSDDPQWVQENILTGTGAIYVSGQSPAAWADLELMSSCHHNVISNSTFSWWGAYRNRNPQRVVVAPKLWRNDGIDTSSLLQDDWIVLD